eukprot:jgi/Galph1/6083/GphlegSOOS_G4691.1
MYPRGMPSHIRVVDVYNNNRVSYHETNLGGGVIELGAYYSNLTLGGEPFSVLIDTGSSTLVVPMKGCKTCGDYGNFYSLEKSNYDKARYIPCDSSACQRVTSECYQCPVMRYCLEIEDLMQWDDYQVPVIFGGMLHETPDFLQTPANGILGMAYPMLSCNPNYMPPIYSVLQQRNMIEKDMFALCLGHRKGQIMIGGVDTTLAEGPFQWAPMDIANPVTYYRVNLGVVLKLTRKDWNCQSSMSALLTLGCVRFIPGSGRIMSKSITHRLVFSCVTLSDEDVKQLPSITVTIGGMVDLTMTPEDYMYRAYDSEGNAYRCLEISTSGEGGGVQATVGDVLLQKHLIIFDRENRKIGFAPAYDCEDKCSQHHKCSSCIKNGCAYNFQSGVCASSRVVETDSSAAWCTGFACEFLCEALKSRS